MKNNLLAIILPAIILPAIILPAEPVKSVDELHAAYMAAYARDCKARTAQSTAQRNHETALRMHRSVEERRAARKAWDEASAYANELVAKTKLAYDQWQAAKR